MIPILPVQTFTVIIFGKLIHVVINHEPIAINDNSRNSIKCSKFSGGKSGIIRFICKQKSKSIVIDRTERINKHSVSHEISFIHVECRSENLNIHHGIKVRIDDDILIILERIILNTSQIILVAHELKIIGSSLNGSDNGFHVSRANRSDLYRLKLTIQNMLTDKVLHNLKFIVVCGGVHAVNNLSNQISDTLPTKECLTKLFSLNGSFVKLLIIEHMERGSNIRNFTLHEESFGNGGVILKGLSNINENLFNGFAIFHDTLLELCPRIRIQFRCDNHSTDSVYKSTKELILENGIVHNDKTDLTNIVLRNTCNRHIILVICACAISDSIKNFLRTCGKFLYERNSRH